MKFQAVKGTRDFYPEQMRLRNWIVDAWRRVSLRNGFEEYDAPIFEYLELFTAKSGQEIAEQLFSLTDRGGRNLAIRPEMTPSLARMVNAKINSLPRPIKWFSVGRFCRAEKPQRGRGREFFQWNVDIIGEDSALADAESVFVAVDALRELGLSCDDIVLRYSSRAVLSEVLRNFGIPESKAGEVMAVLDKRNKLPEDAFEKLFRDTVQDPEAWAGILRFMNMRELTSSPSESIALNVDMKSTQELIDALAQLKRFQGYLKDFGVSDWCEYDPSIIRGFAYYTGIVYEIFDRGASLRAVGGGGRYDDLLEVLGGPKVGGTGFGMGDMVLGIVLEERGQIPAGLAEQKLDYFVIDGEEGAFEAVLAVVGALRGRGVSADFSYARRPIGKQLKDANRRGAARAAIVRGDTVSVKDLATGEQQDRPLAEFLADLRPPD